MERRFRVILPSGLPRGQRTKKCIRMHLHEFHGHSDYVKSVLIPDVSTVISGSTDTTVRVWDVSSGSCRWTLEGHTGAVLCLATHNDLLVSGGTDETVMIWDLTIGQCVYKLGGHRRDVIILGFNDDKTLLAAGYLGGDIKIWNMNNG